VKIAGDLMKPFSVNQRMKIPVCYDDDDDEEESIYLKDNNISELPPVGDEHLDTISETKSDEFIKSRVEILVPNPSESEGENGCDVLACFTTFSNVLFNDDYDSDSSDDQSLSVEAVREKICSNPLFDEEVIPMEIDLHSFNAESDLIESLPNHDSLEKSPDLLSHLSFKAFQPSAECLMIINGKNISLLDVPLFHFYPLDQLKYGGN
nr:hypothetical protein [Tanacetum cinerariifolium]